MTTPPETPEQLRRMSMELGRTETVLTVLLGAFPTVLLGALPTAIATSPAPPRTGHHPMTTPPEIPDGLTVVEDPDSDLDPSEQLHRMSLELAQAQTVLTYLLKAFPAALAPPAILAAQREVKRTERAGPPHGLPGIPPGDFIRAAFDAIVLTSRLEVQKIARKAFSRSKPAGTTA